MYDTNQIFDTIGFAPRRGGSAAQKAQVNDYIAYYGDLMRRSIGPQIQGHGQTKAKGRDGTFLPSCLGHGGFTNTTVQSVSNYVDLIGDWYVRSPFAPHDRGVHRCTFNLKESVARTESSTPRRYFQRGKYPSHVLIDDCKMTDGLPCNPTCSKGPSAL